MDYFQEMNVRDRWVNLNDNISMLFLSKKFIPFKSVTLIH